MGRGATDIVSSICVCWSHWWALQEMIEPTEMPVGICRLELDQGTMSWMDVWLCRGMPEYLSDLLTYWRRTCMICAAWFVVWRPRCAMDTLTNRRQGFLCRRTASMEQAANTAEAAAVNHYFSSSTEKHSSCSILPTDTGKLTDNCFVMHPRSSVGAQYKWPQYCYCFIGSK